MSEIFKIGGIVMSNGEPKKKEDTIKKFEKEIPEKKPKKKTSIPKKSKHSKKSKK